MKKLKRGAYITDIHFGRKSNSQQHNQDCLDFLTWFREQAIENDCDYIAFLGDWNENRTSLNIATMNYSYLGAKLLNDIGVPVYFCVGNHDLYQRHTRDVYSVVPYNEFNNFVVVNTPTLVKSGSDDVLFSPFLFPNEYSDLNQYKNVPIWAGHFEFNGFVLTGYSHKMEHGADPDLFKTPQAIYSGHFHKRQSNNNIHYIGNCFPMDYSDAGDTRRGMMIHDHQTNTRTFIDWKQCPSYMKINLSDLLDKMDTIKIADNARVTCIADIAISYEENLEIRKTFGDQFNLREFNIDESTASDDALTNTMVDDKTLEDIALDNVNDLVIQMLNEIKVDQIDNDLLIKLYMEIQTDE